MKTRLLLLAALLLPLTLHATEVLSTAAEASHPLLTSSGQLNRVDVTNSNASTGTWILLIRATSLPSNGTVTLLYPPIWLPAKTTMCNIFPRNLSVTTGAVVASSSTAFSGTTPTLTVGAAELFVYANTQ